MIKALLVLATMCLVVCSATPIDDKWKPVSPTDITTNTNDKEMQKTFCYQAPKDFEATWALFKLQKCLKQKKIQSKSIRTKRSTEQSQLIKSDMEKLMEHIKSMANEVKQEVKQAIEKPTGSAEEKPTTWTEKKEFSMNMDTKLSCPTGKNIKIISATLTNKDFATKFPECWNKKMEHAEWFTEINEPCSETKMVTKMTSQWCLNKSECNLDWENMFAGVCDCSIKKYLDVTWMCTEKKTEVRTKRSLHYRNDLDQMALERQFRDRIAQLEGIDQVIDYYFNGQAMIQNPLGDYYPDYYPDYYTNERSFYPIGRPFP